MIDLIAADATKVIGALIILFALVEFLRAFRDWIET
jgi:hypothetical protein